MRHDVQRVRDVGPGPQLRLVERHLLQSARGRRSEDAIQDVVGGEGRVMHGRRDGVRVFLAHEIEELAEVEEGDPNRTAACEP